MEDAPATMVLESALLTISIEPAPLAVLSVPNEFVPKCAWLLMRQYSSKSSFNFKSFHSILSDDDGLSIICPAKLMSTFKFLLNPTQYTVSSSQWRAFIINLAGSYEFPGMVFCLADSLSKEGLSILHISTFEAEVVLVQEHDLERACAILREFEDPQKVHRIIEAAWQREAKPQPAVATLVAPPSVDESDSTSAAGHEFDESWLTPQVSAPQEVLLPVPQLPPPVVTPRFAQGFTLCVLPNPVILAKLRDDVDWNVCGPILTSLLLFDERYCPLEKHVGAKMSSRVASQDANDAEGRASRSASDVDARRAQYMWGMWHQNREITFLLDERDVDLFPKDALVTTPQQWRVIKLCGRPIAFNETGVVSAMSKIDANIASLNISTATTNCTLVPEELLEATVQKLSSTLGCPIKFVSVLS